MASLKEKIGYGFGDMSSSMFWKIFSYYLPFFYSNVFGLSLADGALLLLISKLWDAVSDPIMGIIADRTSTKWGRYRPYLLWVAVPFAIAGILTFSTPDFSYTGKLIYAYATYILMMTIYTAINVPYGAMLGVMTDKPEEKTVFSSFRMFFAYAGSFIAIAIFEPLCCCFNKATPDMDAAARLHSEQTSWQLAMIVIGAICAIIFVLCFLWTRERVVNNNQEDRSVWKDIKSLGCNGPWWILLLVAISALLFNSIRGGAAAYFFQNYVGDNNILWITNDGSEIRLTTGVYLAVGEIANMIGVILAVPISSLIGKKYTYMFAMSMAAILSIVFFYASESWLYLSLQIFISIMAGMTFPLLWSMYADVADYSELKNGRSSTGLIFSSSTMAQKFGGAFGSALILWLLSYYGYNTALNSVQNNGALFGLNMLMSWLPGLSCLIAVVALSFYPLSDKKMKDITEQLKKRRENY
jgi:GPH family glycoside/pentoside/hexuronide:cation symporter